MIQNRLIPVEVNNNESEKLQLINDKCTVHLTSTENSEIAIKISGDGKTFDAVPDVTFLVDDTTIVRNLTDCTPLQWIKFVALSGNLTAVKILG